jgi:2'-5' RNA ligase
MSRYLIDIRLMGPVKHQIRQLSDQLAEKFGLGEKLAVPHITLAGPFSTEDEEQLARDFSRICADQHAVPKFRVGGYGFFDTSRVVYVTITPDETLKRFRYQLSKALVPYCTLRKYDLDNAEEFRFHATLAMKLGWLTYRRIRWHFRNQEEVTHRPQPVRATLLKNSKVLCEYDFVQERMLSPAQARSMATFMRDRDMLRPWADESQKSP